MEPEVCPQSFKMRVPRSCVFEGEALPLINPRSIAS
jgi:hypothetical protein